MGYTPSTRSFIHEFRRVGQGTPEYLCLKEMFVSNRFDDRLQYNVALDGVKATRKNHAHDDDDVDVGLRLRQINPDLPPNSMHPMQRLCSLLSYTQNPS